MISTAHEVAEARLDRGYTSTFVNVLWLQILFVLCIIFRKQKYHLVAAWSILTSKAMYSLIFPEFWHLQFLCASEISFPGK